MEEKIKIEKKPAKSPVLAGIFSAIFPGTGAIYNGNYLKGILFIIIFAGLVSIQGRGGQPFVAILMAGFYFFQIIDAVNEANKISAISQAGTNTKTSTSLEVEAEISQPAGSISWGIILILLGGLFLLANFEVINYDDLIRYWPLILVGLGLKLLADYYSGKKFSKKS